MTNIDFYLVKEATITDCYAFVCRLVDKAYQHKHRIHIHANSPEEAKTLDDLLWTFRDVGFIPHGLYQETSDAEAVRIGVGIHPTAPYDILINLTPSIPEFFNHYQRVLEVVPQETAWKNAARKKYTVYKEKSCELITHDLTKPT